MAKRKSKFTATKGERDFAKHPKVQEIIASLALSTKEIEENLQVLKDIYDYYRGRKERLKLLYRGINGGLFWHFAPQEEDHQNLWLTEVSALEEHWNFHSLHWEDIESQDLLEFARDFSSSLAKNLELSHTNFYIWGPSATQKTIMVKALLNFAKTYKSVAFVNVIDIQEKIVGLDYSEIRSILNIAKTVDILALDDIGAETVGDFFRDSILYKVIAGRQESLLLTIFTSSFSLEELAKIEIGVKPSFYGAQKAKKLVDKIKNNCFIIDTNKEEDYVTSSRK